MAIDYKDRYLIALSHFPKFGPKSLFRLKKHFKRYRNVWPAGIENIIKAGILPKTAGKFAEFRKKTDIDKLVAALKKENIKIVRPENRRYPRLLKEIYDPPAILYYKGSLEEDNDYKIAVVGSRKYTAYGKQAAETLAGALSRQNLAIVSGLALGVDSFAHGAAVKRKKRTIAVLGSGLDEKSLYPALNKKIADKIIENKGAVISEFPLKTPPLKHNFPQRNRIISGMSLGTLVIEAGEKSGALITAKYALEQNREVFAVPGSIFSPMSLGPNRLIAMGAKPVASAKDVLEALGLEERENQEKIKNPEPMPAEEELILRCLSHEARHIDEIIRLTKLSVSVINSTLALMEMKGLIKNIGNMQYVPAR